MKEARFNLREWMSSSKRLMEWIDEEEGVPVKKVVKLSDEDSMYAQTQFGVQSCSAWRQYVCADSVWSSKLFRIRFKREENYSIELEHWKRHFVFRFDWLVEFAKELILNKRTVLKVVAKLYDPLGLISPLFITIKTLFQDLCKLKIGWDDPLDEELSLRYSQWLSDLSKAECIPIQRCYLPDEGVISLQLHGFGDGSEVAYAAAVYLRVETSQGVSFSCRWDIQESYGLQNKPFPGLSS